MNALKQSRGASNDPKSMSPLRNSSNGPPMSSAINSYGMGGNTDSAFARSPLGVKRVNNPQPSF